MNKKVNVFITVLVVLVFVFMTGCMTKEISKVSENDLSTFDLVNRPYELDTGLISRSICFENPAGAPGEGGKASSYLGQCLKN